MPASKFTKAADTAKKKRQWDAVYSSVKKRGGSPGSAVRQANASVKKRGKLTGSIWLRDLPTALQSLANVSLFKGWETRCRSSGGYNKLMGIVVHHTASSTSTYNDTNYMWLNAPSKPVGAIYLARNGEVVIGAAGATNCAGRGGPYTTSKGTIALDTANSNTISIEAGNAGTGEAWPTIQQQTYVALVAALCKHYKLDPVRDVIAHHEWAPTRKIDPAGTSKYAAGGNKWNMGRFRDDVKTKVDGTPAPIPPKPKPPTPEEDEVTDDDIARIVKAVWNKEFNAPGVAAADNPQPAGWLLAQGYGRSVEGRNYAQEGRDYAKQAAEQTKP